MMIIASSAMSVTISSFMRAGMQGRSPYASILGSSVAIVVDDQLRRLTEARRVLPEALADTQGASKTQEGFMKFVALPLFCALERAAPSARPLLVRVCRNCERGSDPAACTQAPLSRITSASTQALGDLSASTQSAVAHDELEFCCVEQAEAVTEEPDPPLYVTRAISKE
ncbi:unnamed protein product [Prorocentrum cordatum]|uniref:Uncharacterized protein n=1 Tax=Prorocentrum cordatum TaxID=2364126 RepID=A0ABN9TUX2_9DINO|nr:unnamed protein product [Polarella glacialis]